MVTTSAPLPVMNRFTMALDLLTNGRQMPQTQLEESLICEGFEEGTVPYLAKTVSCADFAEPGDNLVGMGIGVKNEVGDPNDELCIKFYVRERLPVRNMSEAKVPPWLELPGLGVFLTDVEEIGTIELETLSTRLRPALGGYSIGHSGVKGGSIGCLVCDRSRPGRVFVLSNCHILADSGIGQPGDSVRQPSFGDGGTVGDEVAKLANWIPFNFSSSFVNKVDAAIAGPVTTTDFCSEIALLNLIPGGVQSNITIGMKVQKVGRTTGHSTGTVKDVNFRPEIPYPAAGGGIGHARFIDQVLCTRYTDKGDSGALVLDDQGWAVGLHFGGTRHRLAFWRSTSFFSPITFVLDELGVDLVTTHF